MTIRKRVTYSGSVQGVGFRYTAKQAAAGLEVHGFVRNLPSGQVELVAEGEPDQVDTLLARVAQCMAGHIHNAEVHAESPQGFVDFQIRH